MVREGAADPQQELRVVTLYPSRLMGHLGVQQLLSQTVQPLVEPDLRACSLDCAAVGSFSAEGQPAQTLVHCSAGLDGYFTGSCVLNLQSLTLPAADGG